MDQFQGINPLEQCDVNINIPNECFIFEWRIFISQVSSVSRQAAVGSEIDFEKRNLQRIRAALNCLTWRERKVRDIISQIVYISMFIQ